MRVQKTVDGIVHNYYYSDGLLTREEIVYNENYSQTIDFLYDESGLPYSFIYNTYQYYYIKNLQGDVVAIVDNYGYLAAEYTYDAWGNVIDITEYFMEEIGAANPIRYRSYYYDTETGFYYLQSRYYDPAIRRFINADGYVNANGDILGFNMYAYCGNNPVMYVDYMGDSWETVVKWFKKIGQAYVDLRKAELNAIYISISPGVGIGASVSAPQASEVEASLGNTLTDTIEFRNGKFDVKFSSSTNASISFFDLISGGGTWGKEHSYFDENCTCNFFTSTFAEKLSCPANKEIADTGEGILEIGASAGGFLLFGAEVSVGFDLGQYLKDWWNITKEFFEWD